jgi:hypothetical protein
MLTDYFGAMVEAIFKNFGHLNATTNFRRNMPWKAAPDTRNAMNDLQKRLTGSESRDAIGEISIKGKAESTQTFTIKTVP